MAAVQASSTHPGWAVPVGALLSGRGIAGVDIAPAGGTSAPGFWARVVVRHPMPDKPSRPGGSEPHAPMFTHAPHPWPMATPLAQNAVPKILQRIQPFGRPPISPPPGGAPLRHRNGPQDAFEALASPNYPAGIAVPGALSEGLV
jgi:hypothetical protein